MILVCEGNDKWDAKKGAVKYDYTSPLPINKSASPSTQIISHTDDVVLTHFLSYCSLLSYRLPVCSKRSEHA